MTNTHSASRSTKDPDGFVVWFTGLPASGKTTLAATLAANLKDRFPRIELLDAQAMRQTFGHTLGFAKDDRDTNVRRIGFVAQRLSRNGVAAVVAAVSPSGDVRKEVRASIDRFVEVFCDAPLEVLERRDAKGIYARARKGELSNVIGIHEPYEPPTEAEIVCRTAEESIEACVIQILKYLEQEGLISRRPTRAGPLVIRPVLLPGTVKHAGRGAGASIRQARASQLTGSNARLAARKAASPGVKPVLAVEAPLPAQGEQEPGAKADVEPKLATRTGAKTGAKPERAAKSKPKKAAKSKPKKAAKAKPKKATKGKPARATKAKARVKPVKGGKKRGTDGKSGKKNRAQAAKAKKGRGKQDKSGRSKPSKKASGR